MSNEKLYSNIDLCSVITFALIVRWSVSLHPYSGQNVPPMFGDYEAQRHWMEVTVNLPIDEWYFNTSNNDLKYWGLDYPPLTAYHSYINGKIAQYINPEFVNLHTSRGYESYNHKFFMRATVIIADVIVYFVSLLYYFNTIYKKFPFYTDVKYDHSDKNKSDTKLIPKISAVYVKYLVQVAVALLYPGLILIDHGHFQYNSVSLGFTVGAVTALAEERFVLSSFLFVLALNYKQMSLYYSLPFFVYILTHCLPFHRPYSFTTCSKRLISIALTVILTFLVLWFPFLEKQEVSLQVLDRLFPVSRGIFEDKVSNIWCVVNVVYKLKKNLNETQLIKMCIALVMWTSFPSLVNLLKYPSFLKMLVSLVNVSLSFYLFSYQVHEKSILLVALPVTLFFPFSPFACFWFLLISTFSMLPLFIKDNLVIPFTALTVLFMLFTFSNINFPTLLHRRPNDNIDYSALKKFCKNLRKVAFKLSMSGCILIFFCSVFVTPPARYPDLWPLLTSVYSCLHFCLFGLYFNCLQLVKVGD